MDANKISKALLNLGIGEVIISRHFGLWSEFTVIRKLVANKGAEVVDSKFYSVYSWEQDRKPDIQEESTFSECIDMSFNVQDCTLKIVMWDGESFRGTPTQKRCKWIVRVVPESLDFIKSRLIARLKEQAEYYRQVQIQEEEEKKVEAIYQSFFE